MVWEGGPPRSSQILVVVVSCGFFSWRRSSQVLLGRAPVVWGGRLSEEFPNLREWSPVVGGGGGGFSENSVAMVPLG